MRVLPINVENRNKNNFKSRVVMSPEAIDVIADFPSHIRKSIKKQLNQISKNNVNDTVYISGYSIDTSRLSLQVIEKNENEINKSMPQIFFPASMRRFNYYPAQLLPLYENAKNMMYKAGKDMFNKYLG